MPRTFLRPAHLWIALALSGPLATGVVRAGPVEPPSEWTTRHTRADYTLKSATPVFITNLVGDVRVRGTLAAELTVITVTQKKNADPQEPIIEVGHLTPAHVNVSFPEELPPGVYDFSGQRRVDLTVFVPSGSPVSITTGSGLIDARGAPGEVTACSDTGPIRVSTKGVITARSQRGNITAVIGDLGRGRHYRLASEAGQVTVRRRREGAALVTAETSGSVASDFSMVVQQKPTSTVKQAKIQVHTGWWRRWVTGWFSARSYVELKSVKGNVNVLGPLPELNEP